MSLYKWLGKPFKRSIKGEQDEDPKVTQIARVKVYKVEKVWDAKKAAYEYGLYSATEVHFSDGHKNIFKDPFSLSFPKDGWWLKASGNKAWAERTKKHYLPLSGKEKADN